MAGRQANSRGSCCGTPRIIFIISCSDCFPFAPAQVRIELYDRKKTNFISAHTTPLACIALSLDGKRLATASDKGTLVRVWSTEDGSQLQVTLGGGSSGVLRADG